MTKLPIQLTRRELLATAAATGVACATSPHTLLADEPAAPAKIAFFLVSDTHYLADKEAPTKMNPSSAEICGRLVDTLNSLPGTEIPAASGGGRVAAVQGVIHAGDVIDTGDKQGTTHQAMQQTEWATFTADYGLTGKDGRLKYPVYEIHGNHDAPHGTGHAIEKMIERNQTRPGVVNRSANGVHYSWDWGPAHFINLGLIVGTDKSVARKRRYAALDSLEFLISDLREKVGDSGRPLVITHHIDIARYTGQCELEGAANSKEWDACDVHAFHAALKGFNVAGIFYGHTHFRNVFQWDGLSPKAEAGIQVFNSDNASHFSGAAQAFFYVELDAKQLVVREYQTKDRWETGFFTPQTWVVPLT